MENDEKTPDELKGYITHNNEEKPKLYSNKKYYENFVKKHQDKINQKIVCGYCNGSYSYFNKSQHMKSQKCLKAKLGVKGFLQLQLDKFN